MFCVSCRNSRWPPKNGGKVIFLQNVASTLCRLSAGPKFCQNGSISHHFQDKCVFALYAEIQDGCQKWQESDFCEKLPVDSANTLWVQNFSISHCFQDKGAFCTLCRNLRWPPKVGGKQFLTKVTSRIFIYPAGQKFH